LSVEGGTVTVREVGFERLSLGSLFKIGLAVHLPIWTLFYAFILLTTVAANWNDEDFNFPVVITLLCAIPASAVVGAAVFTFGALVIRQIGNLRRFATVEIEDEGAAQPDAT
jgi:hypothetical protein